jgi:hypothetical protein
MEEIKDHFSNLIERVWEVLGQECHGLEYLSPRLYSSRPIRP